MIAVLAPVDGALALIDRRISAHIVDSRIYDRRPKVFGHIQRMPLAFFTRIQTDALVSSRHNNDVMADQKAFTEIFSVGVSGLWRKGFGESETAAVRPWRAAPWPASRPGHPLWREGSSRGSGAWRNLAIAVCSGPGHRVSCRPWACPCTRTSLRTHSGSTQRNQLSGRPVQHDARNRGVDLIEHLD